MKNQLIKLVALSLFMVTFISCNDDAEIVRQTPPGEQNIVEVASSSGSFGVLTQAITDAGLADALQGDGPFTVFAPTDAAFNALPEGTLESLTTEQLAQILQFHVVNGDIRSTDLAATQDVATLEGEEILVEVRNGAVIVNGNANVTNADISASNGTIHAINRVLLPAGIREATIVDQAVEAGSFTTLVGALNSTGLTSTLKYKGDYTVFAPTDAAFSALPSGLLNSLSNDQLAEILTYHVANGEVFSQDLSAEQSVGTLSGQNVFITADGSNVTVNGNSGVVTPNIDVANGVIHAVDQVLLPDAYGTVVDAAAKRYDFETLVSAVTDAGLAGALSDTDATLTVFAPTDAAFDALPSGLLSSLTTQQLATILQYHVLPVNVASGDLAEQQAPESLTGEPVYVTTGMNGVTVNGSASVVRADIGTNNGTIHAINEVILPNEFLNIVQIALKNYNFTTLTGLLADNNLVATLEGDGPFTVFAPTNEAFTNASAVLESLTAAQVADVLTYHVAAAQALSGDLSNGQTVTTVQGEDITVNIDSEGNVTLNGEVNVTAVDIQGTNGVIHVIDGVLVPPSLQN